MSDSFFYVVDITTCFNVQVLCANCHMEVHYKNLLLKKYER